MFQFRLVGTIKQTQHSAVEIDITLPQSMRGFDKSSCNLFYLYLVLLTFFEDDGCRFIINLKVGRMTSLKDSVEDVLYEQISIMN